MKKLKKLNLIGLLTIVLLTIISTPQISKAASKYVSNVAIDTKQKVGNVTFVSKQYKVGSSYYCKIIMKKGGKSKTIDKKTTAAFVTNGKILYYAKEGKLIDEYRHKNTIYKYTVKTGKKQKLVTGTDYTVLGCSGTYLYCGTNNGADGVDLYALNIKTKKKKHMIDVVGNVFVSGSRVVTSTNTGDVGNYPIHSFKLNGTGKKKIVDGILLKAKKGKIYYCKVNEATWKYKVYSCSMTGKSKKALTGWVSEIPAKYYN